MLTLMTRKSYHRTMSDLDDNTLWTQYRHAMDLCRIRAGLAEGKPSALAMWRGYDHALVVYVHSTIQERVIRWKHRYNRDDPTQVDPWKEMDEVFRAMGKLPPFDVPPWWDDLDLYRSHRSALLRRRPEHYEEVWPKSDDSYALLCPVIAEDDPREYVFYISPTERRKLDKGDRILPPNVENRELVYSL